MKIKRKNATVYGVLFGITLVAGCKQSSHQQMIDLLKQLAEKNKSVKNAFNPELKKGVADSLLRLPQNQHNVALMDIDASLGLELGQEQQSVNSYVTAFKDTAFNSVAGGMSNMAIAYMRLGERNNCMLNHNGSSCVYPIKDEGVHKLKTGSTKAIEVYKLILQKNPGDLQSKWLLNVAYMTIGGYPKDVPAQFLIPGLDAPDATKVKPFTDMAADLGLEINSRAGGVIVDDFNNDGYLDIVTSGWDLTDPMHYFQNNKDGTFSDLTEKKAV